MLEGATTVPVVEESTRFSTLSLCALDSDAFDLMGLEMERWRMQLNVPGQNSQIRARILTLPDFAELSVRLLSSGEVMELPPLDRGKYRVILSAVDQQLISSYDVEFIAESGE